MPNTSPSTPLLVDIELTVDSGQTGWPNNNSSIWHSGITEERTRQVAEEHRFGITHISSSQPETIHLSSIQVSPPQIGITQIGTTQNSSSQIGIAQVGSSEVDTQQVSIFQIGTAQVGIGQMSIRHENVTQVGISQVSTMQNYAVESSLPSSIASEEFSNINNSNGVIFHTPVWHSGMAEQGILPNGGTQVSTSQVGINQNGLAQVSTSQVGITEVSTSQVGINQSGIDQIGIAQIGVNQERNTQISPLQIGIAQIGIAQIATEQLNKAQISPTQVNLNQVSIRQEGSPSGQFNPSKVSFPSFVPFEQLIGIHSFSPSIYTVNGGDRSRRWQAGRRGRIEVVVEATNAGKGRGSGRGGRGSGRGGRGSGRGCGRQ